MKSYFTFFKNRGASLSYHYVDYYVLLLLLCDFLSLSFERKLKILRYSWIICVTGQKYETDIKCT